MIEGMQERIKAIRRLDRLAATERDHQRKADAARARKEEAIRALGGVLSVRVWVGTPKAREVAA